MFYNNRLGAVVDNSKRSPYFALGRGTRQGCPLSPLLFAIAIEPLAEAIRSHPDIHVITMNQKQHRISFYANYVLLFITQPKISIPSVLDVINTFSEFSGYIIHWTKSEAMPLGASLLLSLPSIETYDLFAKLP